MKPQIHSHGRCRGAAFVLACVILTIAGAAPPTDPFSSVCKRAFENADRSFKTDDVRSLCSCMDRRAGKMGIAASVLAETMTRLADQPDSVPQDDPLRAVARDCFQELVDEVNRRLKEEFIAEAERRNRQPPVPVAYDWTAWKAEGLGHLQPVPVSTDSATVVTLADGTECVIGKAETREVRQGPVTMVHALRSVECQAGVRVEVGGTDFGIQSGGCAHGRDLRGSISGMTSFTVFHEGATDKVGTIYLGCKPRPK